MKYYLFFLTFIFSYQALADLNQFYKKFESEAEEHFFFDQNYEKLYWVSLKSDHANGTVIISPGRSESRLSYFESAVLYQKNNLNVAIIEHRGQGKSARNLKNSDVGHIQKFDDYTKDFTEFIKQIKHQFKPPYFLVASSMGAAIAANDPQTANTFKKISMHAPLFKIQTKNIPSWVAHKIIDLMMLFKAPSDYALFTGPFNSSAPFEENNYASSKERFNFNNELYRKNTNLRVGGPSLNWVKESLEITQQLGSNVKLITAPVILFQSEQENYVDNETQNIFCKIMSHCQIVKVPKSRHALHLESDENIKFIFDRELDFFQTSSK